MWQSLQKMPFISFSPLLNKSEANNLFLHAWMYYQELEKDLVVFYNEIRYKQNVTYEHFRKNDLPLEYYCLTGLLSDTSNRGLKTIINDIHFDGQLWILHKPDAVLRDYHYKHSKTFTVIIYFTNAWLESYMQANPEHNESLRYFIASDNKSIGQTFENNELGLSFLNKAAHLMKQSPTPEREIELRSYVIDLMHFFKFDCLRHIKHQEFMALDNADLLQIMEVEKILMDNLNGTFPGIGSMAKQIGLSETKLKTNFKKVYSQSVFQYYRQKQMEQAKELLIQESSSIKNIGRMLGYENASKFSTAFKKHHGILPSEIKESEEE